MKIQNYTIIMLCTFLTPYVFTMENKINTIEKFLVTRAKAKSPDAVVDDLKTFLKDPTLSTSTTLTYKEKLVEKLSSYRPKTGSACIEESPTTTTYFYSTEYIDGTRSSHEIECDNWLDRSETRIRDHRGRSPWHNLPFEAIIRTFLTKITTDC